MRRGGWLPRVGADLLLRAFALLLVVAPPSVLGVWGARALLDRADRSLAALTPAVAHEVSLYLRRPVRIGQLGPDFTVARLWRLWRDPEAVGRFPLVLDRVEVGLRPEERRAAGRSYLARARRVALDLSAPGLRGPSPAEFALPAVRVDGLDLLLIRDSRGQWPIARLLPDDGRPPDPSRPPFRSRIEVVDADVRLRDFAARPGALPEENALRIDEAHADLSGWRTLRFDALARARPGTATAARLTGPVRVEGFVARGAPGDRADAPSPGLPAYGIDVRARGISLPYALRYSPLALPVDLRGGWGDLSLSVHGLPRVATPLLRLRARVAGLEVRHRALPRVVVRQISGDLAFVGGTLRVDAAGETLGRAVRATATVSGLDRPGAPWIDARVDAPPFAVAALRAVLPPLALPPALHPGDTLELSDVALSGPLDRLRARGVATVAGVRWEGVPGLERVAARLDWRDGVVTADPVSGTIAGGGTLSGRGRYTPRTGDGIADLRVNGIDLDRFDALGRVDPLYRPRGSVSGLARLRLRTVGTKPRVRGVAFARVDRLRVGALPLRAADVDLALDGDRISVRRARVAGPAGIVQGRGELDLERGLRFEATCVGIDLAQIGDAFGQPGLDGVLSVTAGVEGTLHRPVVTLHDLAVLGPRLSIDGRPLSADAVRGDRVRIAVGRDRSLRVDLVQPLRVSFYPAEVAISGRVSGPVGRLALDLAAQVSNLDIARLLPALTGEPAPYAPTALREDPHYVALARDLGWDDAPPALAGRIVQAQARVTGTTDDPVVVGDVALRQMRVGAYPVESGSVRFAWADGGLRLRDGLLVASAGQLRFDAAVASDGALSGAFTVESLRLETLEPFLEKQVSLAGVLGLSGTLSGLRTRPEAQVRVTVRDEVRVAGLALEGLELGGLRVAADVAPGVPLVLEGGLESARFVVGGAVLRLTDLLLRLPERRLSASAELNVPVLRDVAKVLADLPAEENALNEAIRRVADAIPEDIDGKLKLTVRGETGVTDRGALVEPHAVAEVESSDARIGPVLFTAAAARVRLDDRTVGIERLSLENPNAVVEGGGTLVLPATVNGPVGLDLRLESLQPSLDLVRAFYPQFPLHGALDSVTLVARGTTQDPQLQGTLEGGNLVFTTADRRPLTLDKIRLNARLSRQEDGDLVLGIDDGLVTRGDEEVRLDVALPVDTDRRRVLASRPIRRMEARVKDLRLETLAAFVDLPVEKVAGTMAGRVALEGSLNEPTLAGDLRLVDGAAQFRRVGAARREPLNAITDLDLDVVLAGRDVTVRGARLALGAPAGDRGRSGGAVSGSGRIRLENLEDFTRLFTRRTDGEAAPRLRGQFDLKARLEGLRPDVDNLTGLLGVRDARGQLGLAEAGTGMIDGEVTITGPLLAPVVATGPGRALRLTDVALRLPRPARVTARSAAPVLDPRWQVSVEVPGDARVVVLDSPVVRLEFRGRGDVALSGSMSDPTVSGTLVPTGGFLGYPLARLDLQRGGTAQIAYGSQRVGVNLTGVVAEGKITGIVGGGSRRNTDTGLINTNLGGAGLGAETSYRIQASFNGAIDLAGLSGSDILQQVTLSSEPPLSRQEIIDLLGARRQFDLIASGDTEQAIRDIGSRFLEGGLLRQIFQPLATNVRSVFGLDAFDMSYSLDGTAFFRVVRRLPDPLDRFTVEISKSFTTRESAAAQPYRFGVNYELFQLQGRGRFQPRLLLGAAATSEQRDTLFFVRGTVNY